MSASAWPYLFPMIRGGGLFILIMGVGVMLGAFVPSRRQLFLIFGAAVATLATVFFAVGSLRHSVRQPQCSSGFCLVQSSPKWFWFALSQPFIVSRGACAASGYPVCRWPSFPAHGRSVWSA